MSNDIRETIVEEAGKLAGASKGDASITRRSLADLAAAQRILREQDANDRADTAGALDGFGLRRRKLVPPGAG